MVLGWASLASFSMASIAVYRSASLDGASAVMVCAPLPYTVDKLESRSTATSARSSPLVTAGGGGRHGPA